MDTGAADSRGISTSTGTGTGTGTADGRGTRTRTDTAGWRGTGTDAAGWRGTDLRSHAGSVTLGRWECGNSCWSAW
ncbi:hypothetical protein GCM10011579_094290 [Streptomyces albiflavescens]|uniref:Uncharacterized protein n=1 Tax=Streptomyces albiflavescens TaxID=1623582 RepID=A0A917YGU5_9ACTN|nr:hypothetical protein GCM10011579_094290 [Streptomyces albiflavescens]